MPNKQVELYEKDGAVFRRVTKDLGNGIRVITSDVKFHADIDAFRELNPKMRVRGYHPDTEMSTPSPKQFTLKQLPDYLEDIDSIDVILSLRKADDRKMAEPIYKDRLDEILDDEFGE